MEIQKEVEVKCKVCHRNIKVRTDNPKSYNQVIIDNFVCLNCSHEVRRLKVILKCSKCSAEFQTRILASNVDSYKDWKCPTCIPMRGPGSTPVEVSTEACTKCGVSKGVCYTPGKVCKKYENFQKFGNGDLYSLGKECTILSIHSVDKSRDDIHCFGYTSLYKSTYKVSKDNVVIIKQRKGSRKNFITNIIIYCYSEAVGKFAPVYNKNFERSQDWILAVRDEILKLKIVK